MAERVTPPSPETVWQFHKSVIPGEQNDLERDPESRKIEQTQNILDPPPKTVGDDELRHGLSKGSRRAFS